MRTRAWNHSLNELMARQLTASRHSTVFVYARMKPQPHGKAAYYVTLFVPTMHCSRIIYAAGYAIDLASYSIALLYA